MSGHRAFVCLCMDVTEKDIARAVAAGFAEPELLKRYAACFMGPCQGKACMDTVMETLSAITGQAPEQMRRPTVRPPIHAVTLGVLAAQDNDDA